MKIKLEKRYAPDRFPFAVLRSAYGISAVRGPRGVPNRLHAALNDGETDRFCAENTEHGG